MLFDNRCNNIGLSMAHSYYRYLKKAAIKNFKERIERYEANEHLVGQLVKRLYIVIPSSGTLKTFLNLAAAKNLEPFVRDLAGTKDRKFHQAVYKGTRQKYGRKRSYYVLDVPMCLSLLLRLAESPAAKHRIVLQFLLTLTQLLEDDPFCNKVCRIKYYNDSQNGVASLESIFEENYSPADWTLGLPRTSTNIGFALAFQYHSNFLSRVLKDFPDRILKWEKKHGGKIYPKLIVLVPHSFATPDLYTSLLDDECLASESPLVFPGHKEDVGLFEKFSYQQSLYELQSNLDMRYFVADSPNADYIRDMRKEYGWDRNVVSEARQEFLDELRRRLVEGSPSYAAVCDVVDYDDTKDKVSDQVLRLISDHTATRT